MISTRSIQTTSANVATTFAGQVSQVAGFTKTVEQLMSEAKRIGRLFNLKIDIGYPMVSLGECHRRMSESAVLMPVFYLCGTSDFEDGPSRTVDILRRMVQDKDEYRDRLACFGMKNEDFVPIKGIHYRPGARWIWFYPHANAGQSAEDCWGCNDPGVMASIEIMMAVYLFPEWKRSWNGGSVKYPIMGGMEFSGKRSSEKQTFVLGNADSDRIHITRISVDAKSSLHCVPTFKQIG